MTLVEDRDRWAAMVGAAQRGDASVWPALIDHFEDIAVASAVGLGGDLDEALDIAQDAFVLAFRHIAGLRDPVAFPAWLGQLVRTATNRRSRRRRHATVPLDAIGRADGPGALVDTAAGPEDVALAAVERPRCGPRSSVCPRAADAWSRCITWPECRTRRWPPSSASPWLPPRSWRGPPAPD